MTTPTPFIDPPKPPLWKRMWVRVTAAVLVLIVVFGALSDPSTDSEPVAADQQTTRTERETTTTERETTTTTEKPRTTTTEDPTQAAMLVWASDNVQYATDLVDQFDLIANAAGDTDLAAMEYECRNLTRMIATVEAETLPVPVAAVDRPWRAALRAYGEGAAYCVIGASTFDVGSIETATALFLEGVDYLDEATAALTAYTESL